MIEINLHRHAGCYILLVESADRGSAGSPGPARGFPAAMLGTSRRRHSSAMGLVFGRGEQVQPAFTDGPRHKAVRETV